MRFFAGIVRNADSDRAGTVTAKESVPDTKTGGKVLIAYFSWGGNTRGIAQDIQKWLDVNGINK